MEGKWTIIKWKKIYKNKNTKKIIELIALARVHSICMHHIMQSFKIEEEKVKERQQQQKYVHEKADEHENIKTCCVLFAFIHDCIKKVHFKMTIEIKGILNEIKWETLDMDERLSCCLASLSSSRFVLCVCEHLCAY